MAVKGHGHDVGETEAVVVITKITDTTEEAEKRGAVTGEARRLVPVLAQRGRGG